MTFNYSKEELLTILDNYCVNMCPIVCKVKDRINKENCNVKNFIEFMDV